MLVPYLKQAGCFPNDRSPRLAPNPTDASASDLATSTVETHTTYLRLLRRKLPAVVYSMNEAAQTGMNRTISIDVPLRSVSPFFPTHFQFPYQALDKRLRIYCTTRLLSRSHRRVQHILPPETSCACSTAYTTTSGLTFLNARLHPKPLINNAFRQVVAWRENAAPSVQRYKLGSRRHP